MISRTLAMPTLLAASVAVPYVATNAPEWTEQMRKSTTAAPAATVPQQPTAPGHHAAGAPAQTAHGNAAQPAHAAAAPHQAAAPPAHLQIAPDPTYSLSEVLRFDVTKEWVYQRWERKSTALADLDLFGVRVPLVTGKQVYDIAGSLTYFFGADGRVKRISFRGRTGDTTQLAMLLHQRFGLQAVPSVIAGQQLLQVRQGTDVISELRTQTAPILWSNTPHESFSVEFELQDPAAARPLKPQVASVSTPPAAAPPGAAAKPGEAGAADAAGKTASAGAKAKEVAPAEKPADAAPEALGWKTLLPRSRASQGQIDQLERSNFYQ
ncbi:DUF6690 family protein [Lacipirellula limnantheis]|uniref:DUF6690 domain-containing protein n=1 Tax=Lacipirellula limnantheis TaxID=2528024 RepID=A0A517TZZ8_9BACT|nr:DUF6690 family protein [Lacipirellula limnantheis]QDT73946.1 hypothetical protein I41_31380 [Lacipirellula limnantheis]